MRNNKDRVTIRWCARRAIWAIALGIAWLVSLPVDGIAQSSGQILKAATRAHGGEKLLRRITSWQVEGTITRLSDRSTGRYLGQSQSPNLYRTAFDLRGLEFDEGFNGKSGWVRDSRDGLRTLTGAASREFEAEAVWRARRWLDLSRQKAKVAALGQVDISGKTAHKVLLTTARNIRLTLYFDRASGLLLREEIPLGETMRVFDYADYRPVGGVPEPHRITFTLGEESFEIQLDRVAHNPSLERARFDFPRLSNEPLPDIPTLLEAVRQNEDRVDELLERYTYRETIIRREIDSQGRASEKESNTYELTFYQGNRIRRLVARSGRPLTPQEEENETRKVEKRVREIEKREAEKKRRADQQRDVAQSTTGSPDPERGERISIADVLRASQLVNPRRERFRGREVIVFDFEPMPGYKPRKDFEKFFGKMAGAIWVDALDKQVARVDARLVSAFKVAGGLLASLREGASFVLEADRVNNEIWLPTRADINLNVKVLLVKGITVNQTIAYGNYQRFSVDSEKEKLADPTPETPPLN